MVAVHLAERVGDELDAGAVGVAEVDRDAAVHLVLDAGLRETLHELLPLGGVDRDGAVVQAAEDLGIAGTSTATATPPNDAGIASRPMTADARRSTFLRLELAIVPVTAVGIIMSSDVPFATRSPTPKRSINAGTMMTPPPIPSSPDTTPTTSPSASSESSRRS